MALKIFGTDPADAPRPRQSFADDVVAYFHSGHTIGRRPVSLDEFRVTTGDPEVAKTVHDLLGGHEPQEWATEKENNLEVFTASDSVEIIIPSAKSLRQRMVLWSSTGKLIVDSDGETLADGSPDPDAELSFAERKAKGNDGMGPKPQIDLFFRLVEDPELGIFRYRSGSWSLAEELAAYQIDAELEAIGGPARATLALEKVEYTAKRGPRAGQLVQYTKPTLKILGPAEEVAEAA